MEDVEGVQHLLHKDIHDGLLGHVHLTLAKLHTLQLSQIFVADAKRTRVQPAQLIAGDFTAKLDGNKLVAAWLPLEIDEPVGEEDRQALHSLVCAPSLLQELATPLGVVVDPDYLKVAVATLAEDVRRLEDISCATIQPIPLHRLAPIEKDWPDEESDERE